MPTATKYDLEGIRERLSMEAIYRRECGELRRSGSGWTGLCPFHEERTPSFHLRVANGVERGHCFGCGWGGDLFDFWGALRGVGLGDAIGQLAGLAGVAPAVEGVEFSKRPKMGLEGGRMKEEWSRPPIPVLDRPTEDELAQLAEIRGLQVPGLKAAVRDGRLRCTDWPQFFREGQWRRGDDVHRSWCVTDRQRWCAEYRRLDGGMYRIRRRSGEAETKSWSTRNMAWPLGAADLEDRRQVIVVEGGADMLAAYHFLWGLNLLDRVGVVCVLGASNRIADRALKCFKGLRVRICMDADEGRVNERTGKRIRPGSLAASRWQDQLTEAGAAVEVFSLEGIRKTSGEKVKDLNDLVHCSAHTMEEERVWELFLSWDF